MKKKIMNFLLILSIVISTVGVIPNEVNASKNVQMATESTNITKATFSKVGSKIYTGNQIRPAVIVKYNSKKLEKNVDYTVSYATNKKVGKGTITIKGKGKFNGTKTITFKINPKGTSISSVTAAKKAFAVKWNKRTTQVTGYQVQYSTKSSFSNAKKKTISSNSTTSKKVSELKGNQKYYVRVRTYKTVDGTKYYSSWSKAKTIKTKSSGTSTSSKNKSNTVFITETGKKYHCRKSCTGLNNANKIYSSTLSKAKSMGLTPCKRCY